MPTGREGGGARPRRDADGDAATAASPTAVAVEDEPPLIVRDVELMRRLYRSGESEYLIDGENCRLRDVQDLLMDSGLGIKAYAVIEQGKIGQILSARPTDRRQLIEEAAGVTKYKSRRRAGGAQARGGAAEPHPRRRHRLRGREAARHAEAAGGQGAALPAPARGAAAVGEGPVRAPLSRARTRSIESARTRLADARVREAAAAARLAELETTLERLRLELTEADATTDGAREAAHARELEIGRLQQQIAFDKQQVETLSRTAAEIEQEVESLDSPPGAGAAGARGAARSAGHRAAERRSRRWR